MKKILEISQLGKSYPTPSGGEAVIVKNFNLDIQEGEFVSILGHSGCGKSTVLSIVMGLSELSYGGVILGGREIDGPGIDRGVVFQAACLFPWFSVIENILISIDQVHNLKTKKEKRELAQYYLKLVGLEGSENRYPNEMSAGMRQRVGIARAFAMEPKILLLDEPFSLLDALTRLELQSQLTRIWEQDKKTVLMVTHDVDEALFLSDRIVMMTSGPAAGIGKIISVPFDRPRDQAQLFNHPDYFWMRDRLTNFLEDQSHQKKDREASGEERVKMEAVVDQ
ncbi:MAG: ABC transporter ATP-binding protein [Elusimicrobiota bacterium]